MTLHEIVTDEKIKIDHASVNVYEIPTDGPESDGTIKWKSTTLVIVELQAGEKKGIGYTIAILLSFIF